MTASCPDKNEIYVVMGLARSGLAAARFLLSRGSEVRVTDIKPAGELEHEVRALVEAAAGSQGRLSLHLGAHPLAILEGVQAIILSPGIPLTVDFLQAAIKRHIPIWSEVELAFRNLKGTLVGITGSNGKSTTTALTAHILALAGRRAFAVGNIGEAMSDYLIHDSKESIYVTELSSFQLETIDTFRPRFGAILNITPDHLDRYPSMEEYALAKWNIFRNMGPVETAVLNGRDERLVKWASRLACPVYFFHSHPAPEPRAIRGAGVFENIIWVSTPAGTTPVLPTAQIPIPGRHNLENALAAALICHLLGLPTAQIAGGIRSFRALPHRLEQVAEIAGRSFYNDSKATNVDSTLLALEAFDRPIMLILGGKDKGSDYSPLLDPIKHHVRLCLLIGLAAEKIATVLGPAIPQIRCSDMSVAVKKSLELSQPGDVVLLSPACASFDMFNNFEHRGEVFRQAVFDLKKEVGP